jgi:CRP/FNR family cyclic AMP-dependent transcriptional regulator
VDHAALLARSELFSALDPASLATVLESTRPCSFRRNELIFAEGDDATDMYVVRNGRVAIASRSVDGRTSVLALMEAGDLFGEMSMFDGEGRSAEARALEPSELLAIPFPAVRTALEERPGLLWEVTALLARRLRLTDAALADPVFLDVPGRTAKRLLEIAGDADEFTLPVTQEELAGMVGASRERVNKAISAFVRLGWLEQLDRRYRILNRPQLELRAR